MTHNDLSQPQELPKRCHLCKSDAASSSDLCATHKIAETNVKTAFSEWLRAFNGEISMKEYLERIVKLPETGEKAKEIAAYLLKK
jgi:hypothetical protein